MWCFETLESIKYRVQGLGLKVEVLRAVEDQLTPRAESFELYGFNLKLYLKSNAEAP